MKKTEIKTNAEDFPQEFRPLLEGVHVYDSSCSPEARVYYIARDGGYYVKKAPKGTLGREADMTRYFHSLGLGANLLSYISDTHDWMLSQAVRGEDCTHKTYLDSPKRLCDTLAELLRELHDKDGKGCPVPDRTIEYIKTAKENRARGICDTSYFYTQTASAEDIWRYVCDGAEELKSEVLLHGDFCLPNVMLDSWQFAAFIDVGNGGIGDRHVDLFWGAWTLCYNLGTDKYRARFFDAYGKDAIDTEKLRIVSACECFG